MKRQRGRNRRSGGGGNNPNRHYESNGPDVKIRGSAQQVLEKYLQYARDAHTSGDRVMSEAYFQHAEHYQRLLAAMQPRDKPRRDRDDRDERYDESADDGAEARGDDDMDDDDGEEEESSARQPEREPRERQRHEQRREREPARETARREEVAEVSSSDPLKVIDGDEAEGAERSTEAAGSADAGSGRSRRRRPYKKRDAEAEAAEADGDDTDGVMKTLSRGRPRPSGPEADVETIAAEPADE